MVTAIITSPARVARSFMPGAMPAFSRRNYRWELGAAALMPAALACVEGGVIGVIAKKGFQAPDLVIAALSAAPPLSLLTSVYWTRFLHGRDRVRAALGLQAGILACVALLAAAPLNSAGIVMLVLLQLLARSFMAGVFTARSDLWRANYPRSDRARVTGKLTIVATVVMAGTGLLVGAVMDRFALGGHGYRPVYVLAAITGAGGIWAFSHIRWRGRAAQLRSEHGARADGRVGTGPRDMIRVLRADALYRRYMLAMFIMGAPNIAAMPVFIIALQDRFPELGYTPSIILTHIIPMATPILFIPMWARLLDRVHIIRFRVYHCWFFVTANALMGVGILMHSLPVLFAARFILGIAFAGGMLAWQLGHHDFARREIAHIYMGIHVTLTGVRGAFAPFLGAILYSGIALSAQGLDLSFPGIGGWTFVLLALVGTAGTLLFVKLHLDTRGTVEAEPRHD